MSSYWTMCYAHANLSDSDVSADSSSAALS